MDAAAAPLTGWKMVPRAVAGAVLTESPPSVACLAALVAALAPPGTVLTARMLNRYAEALNALVPCVFHGRVYGDHDFFYGPQCRRCGVYDGKD